VPFDARLFIRLVILFGLRADRCVVPDIVMGGRESMRMSWKWLPWVLQHVPGGALVPVQDGMDERFVVSVLGPLLGPRVGLFVGGGDEFKDGTMHRWARLCREYGAWCHVGRVNTARRIRLCAIAGVDSIDGSSASRYEVNQAGLDAARRQLGLRLGG
jgi:hypothetical protein